MIGSASIAIAIITKNRCNIVSKALDQHQLYSNYDQLLIIDDHGDFPLNLDLDPEHETIYYSPKWLGVAGARNKALSLLDHYDYIFLMDDDIFPKKSGWVERYIETSMHYGDSILLQAIPVPWANITNANQYICTVDRSTATLILFTKPILAVLGGFDSTLGKYGHEDADLFHRARKSGIMPIEGHYTIPECKDYLHICDIYGDFQEFKWSNKSVLGDDKLPFIEESRTNLTNIIAAGNPVFKPYK